jgi:SAM-dependent methyltransferase
VNPVHYDKCPLCLSEKIDSYLRVTDHFLSKEIFTLFRCDNCGFIFTQDHPDENSIPGYYKSENYLSHNDKIKSLSALLYRIVRSIMLKRKLRIVKIYSGLSQGTLLDIGSGSGHFASFMKSKGWVVSGIEIDKHVRERSSIIYGLQIVDPDQISTFKSGSFDCITLWHSLEHFQDPYKYAGELKRLLKPDGICIIALPNSASCDAHHYMEYWGAWDVPRHLWHFTPETFRLFSEKSGLVLKDTLDLPFDVYYISTMSEKYRSSPLYFISGIIKGMWFCLLSSVKKERSSSMVYILNK